MNAGSDANLVSNTLDHARAGCNNRWLWIPIISGVLATVAPAENG